MAKVKIIKCLIENIVVDISFNQVGGLCTLCFLDEVDLLISRNHLFKKSIILIKAWCYYESRIIGAYFGLISTYALEILVLYIFHVFNGAFAGPFEVLYRFLEFFSNFDWDNFCVSIWGPVPISSLPDMTSELPRKDGGKLFFDKLFLEACSAFYAASLTGLENQGQQFVSKHLNIIDPLRTSNNLGRSVNKDRDFSIVDNEELNTSEKPSEFVVGSLLPEDEIDSNEFEIHDGEFVVEMVALRESIADAISDS